MSHDSILRIRFFFFFFKKNPNTLYDVKPMHMVQDTNTLTFEGYYECACCRPVNPGFPFSFSSETDVGMLRYRIAIRRPKIN